jgi:Mn-dependent DtxR family transcriptional regulator
MGQRHTTSELAKVLGVKWDTTAHMRRRLSTALARPGLVQQLRDATRNGRDPLGRQAQE